MDEARELMSQIAKLAPSKRHTLARYMVDGSRQLTAPQARMVLAHLGKCDDLPGAVRPQPSGGGATVTRQHAQGERPAATTASTPNKLPGLASFKDIPAGFYATPSSTGSNDLDFWKVKKGTKGQWKGYAFPVRVLGGGSGSELRTVDLPNIQQRRALQAIQATGAEQAKKAFADYIGRCSECGLPLTDETSRRYGKGPTCRAKRG